MKNGLIVAVGCLFLLMACTNITNGTPEEVPVKSRIVGKDTKVIHGVRFFIIEVNGKEYLTSTRGGFQPLASKPAF